MIDVAKLENARGERSGQEQSAVEVVEILVPGLGTIDRDALLRPTGVDRISGDNKAGLYRGVDPDKGRITDDQGRRVVQLERELYDWTRLTIGGAWRALWLFLLPFLLINLVAWMQPRWPCGTDKLHTKVAGAVYEFGARLLALSLTVLVVGTFGQVAMDQFAWQCSPRGPGGPSTVCAPGNEAVKVLGQLPGPAVALVLAAMVPAAVVFVLLFFARDSRQEYLPVKETVTAQKAEEARRKRATQGEDGHPLELEGFWEHNRRSPGIAAQHVWAGVLTAAALLTWTPMHEDPPGSGRKAVGLALFGVILVMALVVVCSVPWLHNHFGITLPEGSLRRRSAQHVRFLYGKRFTVQRPVITRRGRPAAWLRRRTSLVQRGQDDETLRLEREVEVVEFLPLWPTRHLLLAGISCGAVTAAAVLYCLWPGRQWHLGGQLPGILVQSTALLVAQGFGILLLVIGAVFLPGRAGSRTGRTKNAESAQNSPAGEEAPTAGHHHTSSGEKSRRRMALYGLAGAATAVLACFVGWLYTDAVAQWTSSWLAVKKGKGPEIPDPAHLMGMMLVPLLIAAGAFWAAVTALVRFLPPPRRPGAPVLPDQPRRSGTLREFMRRLHPVRVARTLLSAALSLPRATQALFRLIRGPRPASRMSEDDRRHMQEVRAAHRRHNYLLRELDWLMAFAAPLILILVAAYYLHWGIQKSQEGARNLVYDVLGSVSGPMLAGLAALMVLALRTMAMRQEMRQNAGLAWAFGAFWPRAVHPFAPPPWTVRAVPELVWRLKALLEEEGKDRRVLIRANSMGAVLAMAAVWQLKDPLRERIALLTTGCPARTYFTRLYPGFVCADSIACLAPCGGTGTLAGWINVWRDTDPLGGPVGLDCVDERWSDNGEGCGGPHDLVCERTKEAPVFPPIDGHRGYTTDKRLLGLRAELVRHLLEPGKPSRRPAASSSAVCCGLCPVQGPRSGDAGQPTSPAEATS